MGYTFRPGDRIMVVRGDFSGCEGWITRESPIPSLYAVILDGDIITRAFNVDDLVLAEFLPDGGVTFPGGLVLVGDSGHKRNRSKQWV